MSHPAAAAAADPNPGGRPPGRGDWIRLFAIVFVAFAAGSLLAWEVFGSEAGPAFFYPPAGVTVAAMILSRRRLWPAVVAGIFAAEMLVDILFQTPLLVSVGFALANTIEPIVGASLVLAWCGGRPDLGRHRDFAAFIVGAAVLGPLSGCLIGGSLKAVTIDAGSPWLSLVLNWWAGDALGVLVVAAPILLWATQSHFVRRRLLAWLDSGPSPRPVPPTVLACAPDDWHEVSLLMLGVLLRRQGWPVSYLGPAVPLPDLASFVRAARPAAVVLVAMLPESARALQAWPEHLPELAERGRPPVCFAGRGFTAEPALLESMPGHYLGSSLESGVARLLEILGESTGRRSD